MKTTNSETGYYAYIRERAEYVRKVVNVGGVDDKDAVVTILRQTLDTMCRDAYILGYNARALGEDGEIDE